jgi:hypothetical protein
MSRWKKDEVPESTQYMRKWLSTTKGEEYKKRQREYMRDWRKKNPGRFKVKKQEAYYAVRSACFEAYGGPVCKCCGETMIEFLHLDHKNADGSKMRRDIQEKEGRTLNGGTALYWWLKKQNFPQDLGLQVLCANCNLGKRTGPYCPHELKRGIDMNGNPITIKAVV